ncbi:MAG: hypothetical protein HFE75_05155 [Firmicutes bacterium]|jgi:hypothetical protein|nr:hypothetical protein [Bacillota bacterium]
MAQMTLPTAPTVHTTIYSDLKGVDFSTDPTLVYKKRSPTALNMISDDGGNPKKRTGWKVEKVHTENKETVFSGSVTPVASGIWEMCRLQNLSGTLSDIEMRVNGVFVKFNEFSETTISYTAKYLDNSGNVLIYVTRSKSQTYGSLYVKLTGDSLVDDIHKGGNPYDIQIYRSGIAGGVRDMWSFSFGGQTHLIYLIGKKICRLQDGDAVELLTCESTASNVLGMFTDAVFCLLMDNDVYSYVNAGTRDMPNFRFEKMEPYVPEIRIWKAPGGESELLDNVNLLTRRMKELYIGNDASLEYYTSLPISQEESVVVRVKTDGAWNAATSGYVVDYEKQCVRFDSPKVPVPDNEDNVSIEYTASGESSAGNHLKRCKAITLYEGKIFLSGSSDEYGSHVWYSAYNNPAYFPDLNYLVVGGNDANVMGLIGLGEYLGVVKEAGDASNTVYLVYATTLDDNATYACKQSISGVGAVSMNTFKSLNGEQLFLSKNGVCGLNSETAKNRSKHVDKRLTAEPGLEKAVAAVWNGFYVLGVNDNCYLLDGRQKNSWRTDWTNYVYECYFWDNVPAAAFVEHEGKLWFGTADGRLCRFKTESEELSFSDDGKAIFCEWSTPFDNDGATQLFKTMTKKGGLCSIEGARNTSVDVYMRADNEAEIYLGTVSGNGSGLPIEFHFNKKKKKYKRLQLIFRNSKLNEGLKINEIVKSYTVGTYSKNKAVTSDAES